MGSSSTHDSARRLRLVGVADNGDELVLSTSDGEEFYLPINDALRNAATRPIGRPAAVPMRPRLSLATRSRRCCAGTTVDELGAQYDITAPSEVRHPIVAERWIARQAQELEVAAPQLGNHAYEAVFGDEPALLGEMVNHRLQAMGLNPESVQWDAWREADSPLWTISANFSVEGLGDSAIGDPPPALWSYKLQSQHLENSNRWAQFSANSALLIPVSSTSTRSRLSTVWHTLSISSDASSQKPHPYTGNETYEELLDVLHARRGQRLGVDEEADDELAAMITRDEEPTTALRPKLVVSQDDAPDHELEEDEAEWTTEYEVAWSDTDADDPTDWDGQEVVAGEVDGEPESHGHIGAGQQLEGQTDAFEDMADDETAEALKKPNNLAVLDADPRCQAGTRLSSVRAKIPKHI